MFRSNLRLLHQQAGILNLHGIGEVAFSIDDLDDLGHIEAGANGSVCKMAHRPSGKLMAVKRVRIINRAAGDGGGDHESEMNKKRLDAELNAIRRSSECPQIVKFYGTIDDEGSRLVCMELMDISLENVYRTVYSILEEKFPEDLIGFVTVSVLKALNHLKHSVNMIHRDVKPSNILLDRQGHIKLCDFGISGYLINSLANTGVGCRPYMAPERFTIAKRPAADCVRCSVDEKHECRCYDIRSDVWSLGITLYEIATGKHPYEDHYFEDILASPIFRQLQRLVDDDAPVMTDLAGQFTPSMINFINSCLIKNKELRPKFDALMVDQFYKRYDSRDEKEALQYVGEVVARVLPFRNSIPVE